MTAKRLLILDDDPMTGQTIQRIAEFAGVDVRFTLEPGEFFKLFDTWQPTHIALDLVMPEMDGVQVMGRLAGLNCQAKIIITSGVGGRILDAAGRSAAEHGLNIVGVLAKPFSPANLRELLIDDSDSPQPSPQPPGPSPRLPFQPAPLTAEDIELALLQQEFQVVYQPKVACKNGALAGFEALVRWHHPSRGIISPMDFIPLAERLGFIDDITEQVINHALGLMAILGLGEGFCSGVELPPDIRSDLKLAINISAKTISNVSLFDHIAQNCGDFGIDPHQFIFELTETSAMDDPVASLDLLTRLRIQGFHLSIDDFGTGFSSMLQLVRLPFSEIKVDKSFVMTAMQSQESRTVVKFIVDLGHSLGLTCTAEGVEDAKTLLYLKEVGCDLAQGYHIARPMTVEAIKTWVAQQNFRESL
ncbi:EAL domain-containing response regulator [Candidatus Synechococcus calcipolaris G9]|uniref:EAL domain-containing response regulator n=1 Tax=Candidatus Synechococcus calcipolaris G9 TaxID=1497997 RepID=A0ABT6F1Y5_9SYNE|nr:EAL domain-containing response regulator [Candidatus Synechococcus calcipolaris]MDG2991786.1 EAL domain-containing response regulator [Candidatus Synechococcus calcipolaris G9]